MDENKEKIELDKDTKYAMDIINANHERQDIWQKRAMLLEFIIIVVLTVFIIWRETSTVDEVITATQTVSQDSGEGGTNAVGDYNYYGGINGETDDNTNGNNQATQK